jgi:hypothetical protein
MSPIISTSVLAAASGEGPEGTGWFPKKFYAIVNRKKKKCLQTIVSETTQLHSGRDLWLVACEGAIFGYKVRPLPPPL